MVVSINDKGWLRELLTGNDGLHNKNEDDTGNETDSAEDGREGEDT